VPSYNCTEAPPTVMVRCYFSFSLFPIVKLLLRRHVKHRRPLNTPRGGVPILHSCCPCLCRGFRCRRGAGLPSDRDRHHTTCLRAHLSPAHLASPRPGPTCQAQQTAANQPADCPLGLRGQGARCVAEPAARPNTVPSKTAAGLPTLRSCLRLAPCTAGPGSSDCGVVGLC
jgi:hypothetical protein